MDTVKKCLQHMLNPLHVFCRLREAGLSSGLARHISRAYEVCVYRLFLG